MIAEWARGKRKMCRFLACRGLVTSCSTDISAALDVGDADTMCGMFHYVCLNFAAELRQNHTRASVMQLTVSFAQDVIAMVKCRSEYINVRPLR